MAEFAVIKQSQAPRRPTTPGPLRARMAQYEDYVASLRKGEAGRLVPTDGEAARGLALRVTRAATRLGRPVEVWTAESAVYFKLT
ncbi:MAG: hypothetical protein WD557_04010 [Dehalococcoidia bacterium]